MTRRLVRSAPRSIPLSLLGPARLCLYGGFFAVSLLVLRVAGSITVGDVLLVSAAGLTVADAVATGRRFPLRTSAVASSALVLFGGIAVSFVAEDPSSGALVLARVMFLAFVLPWVTGVLLNTPQRLRAGVMALGAGAAVCGAGAVVQLLVGDVIPGSEATTGGRFPGFAVHVSDTGGITSLAVVYGSGLLLSRRRVAGVLVFAAGLAGLILSGSVSGMIAAGAGLLMLLVWHRVHPVKLALLAIAVYFTGRWALQAMAASENSLSPMERLLQVTGATATSREANTSSTRWESILAGWDGFTGHPIIGAGLEPDAAATFGELPAHNIAVAALYQGGALFALGVGIVIWCAARPLLRRPAPGLAMVIAAGTVTALVFAMTAPSFYNRYFWLPVALSLVAFRMRLLSDPPRSGGVVRFLDIRRGPRAPVRAPVGGSHPGHHYTLR